ncbi:uncharacterized protein LOC116166960 [Photinus pyralis]|uniref:uncharacterized protein LOC116166960 n=1 Tax=Photinus pyralis TaxID=7054 RepID=UPI0012676205|nr:uncharacterized protein LOC116166960 [Photinus pyralis]
MKDKFYKVEISINKSADIIKASCSCPKGIKCHHIAALAIFGHYNISVTDRMLKKYSAIDRDMTETELQELQKRLNNLGDTVGFTWLLKDEPTTAESITESLPLLEEVIFCEEYHAMSDKVSYLKQKSMLAKSVVLSVANLTVGQAENEKWYLVRKYRLTASNFGLVLAACKRNRFPPSLFKSLSGDYNLDGVKAIQWGKQHEKIAIQQFEKATDLTVLSSGIWLSTSGILGASPDGDDAIVEVKCPYTYRNDKLSSVLRNGKGYIIYFEKGTIVVNREHKYFDQIQGLLHIMQRKKCYLCIWTTKELLIVNIDIDLEWENNLNILEHFYFYQYIPKLLQSVH